MRIKYFLLLSCLSMFLSGCATPYGPVGYSGGYQTQRIAEDTFVVSFLGNGFTEPQRAKDFAMLQAAETCLKYNYRYYQLWGSQDLGGVDTRYLGSTSTTTGSVTPGGYYNASTVSTPMISSAYKPGTAITIRCYDTPPTGKHAGEIFEAKKVRDTLDAKYNLKPSI